MQRGLESRKQRQISFAQRRQAAPNAGKCLNTNQGAKAARNFLLDLDHAQIALGLIVIKRHAPVFQKGPDGALILAQPIQ